jgi:hypothetical protein
MAVDMESFRPPDDPCFNKLLEYALSGTVPVYGAVLETARVRVRRFDDGFRPENSIEGQKALVSLMQGWNSDSPVQPWLYAEKDVYVCADDYFFSGTAGTRAPTNLRGAGIRQASAEGAGARGRSFATRASASDARAQDMTGATVRSKLIEVALPPDPREPRAGPDPLDNGGCRAARLSTRGRLDPRPVRRQVQRPRQGPAARDQRREARR